jgi:hypothetical protein
MKAYMESRDIAALILNTRHYVEVSGQLHVQATLPPGKESMLPIEQGAGLDPRAGLDVLKKRKIS